MNEMDNAKEIKRLRGVIDALAEACRGYLLEHEMSRLRGHIKGPCPCMLCRGAWAAIAAAEPQLPPGV